MNEAQEAWRMWHLVQAFSDALWEHYEKAFLDYCIEEQQHSQYCGLPGDDSTKDMESPF